MNIDNNDNQGNDESSTDDTIIFNKSKMESDALIIFNNYQVVPLKTNVINDDINDIIKLKFIDKIFNFKIENNYYLSPLITIISIVAGIISCIPLYGYNGDIELMTLFDLITCIIKSVCGGLIFIGCWYNTLNGIICNIYIYNKKKKYDQIEKEQYYEIFKQTECIHLLKKFIIILFASIYAFPYAWEYWDSPNTSIKYLSVPLYFISLLQVFYHRTVEQFRSTDNSFTVNRKKNVLLDSINCVIKNSKNDYKSTNKILNELNYTNIRHVNDISNDIKFSVMFAVNNDYIFYSNNKEELTELYEDDNYDKFKSIRKTSLNLLLGIIYISLLITLIDQYQSLLIDIFISNNSDTNFFLEDYNTTLWIAIWISIIEAGLFIFATYNIHHNYITKIFSFHKFTLNKIIKLLLYSPMISAGVVLAITRLQSSYISFAKIATSLELRKDMGYFLIAAGMSLSFSIEMSFMIKTCIHLINTTSRNILTSRFIPDSIFNIEYIKNRKNLALLILYGKKMKKIVMSLNDEGIKFLMRTILQR